MTIGEIAIMTIGEIAIMMIGRIDIMRIGRRGRRVCMWRSGRFTRGGRAQGTEELENGGNFLEGVGRKRIDCWV